MTDIAERKGGARRAWPKGAVAQMGHASKRSPREILGSMKLGTELKSFSKYIFNLFLFISGVALEANPYTLEYSLTGTETVSLESKDYSMEAGWEVLPEQLPDVSYEVHPEVHAYIVLFTDSLTGESAVLLTDGAEVQPGWKKTGWFGFFFADFYPWVYHVNMGWIYVSEKTITGAWFHHERLGWVWTNPDLFPSLYMNKRAEWTYLNLSKNVPTLYDYGYKEWFEANQPYTISGSAIPGNGGTVSGLGEYYRWEKVSLEATASSSYNFAGWGGDLRGNEEKKVEFEATKSLSVDATFVPLISPTTSPKQAVSGLIEVLGSMNNLSAEEKKKSLAELLITGKSETSGLSITPTN